MAAVLSIMPKLILQEKKNNFGRTKSLLSSFSQGIHQPVRD